MTLIFIGSYLAAQEAGPPKKPYFGIKSGINFTKLKLDGKLSGTIESNYRTGFVAGAFFNVPLGRRPFSIQPEFLYSSMGGDLVLANNQKMNLRFNYFSVPVLFKYRFTNKLQAFAGPQVDIKIYAKEDNIFGEFDATDQLEEFDALATWGLEWWPWNKVVLNGRYMHGFRKVYQIGDVSTNNRGFQVTLGLRFGKPSPLPKPQIIEPEKESDRDNDGIFDRVDKCPDVPGIARYEGCPVPDTDKDGVFDDKDKCPEVVGYPELDGCPYPDRDRDGVTDNKDRCPDEPGSTKNDGCPITDRDNDGVPDNEDRCPDTPGPASNQGCPEIEEEVIEKTAAIAKSIYFETNSSRLKAVSHGPLDELVQILNENPTINLTIEGHTDNTGSDQYNMRLSTNRVNSVKNYLISKGIDASRLTAQGYGEERPVADNSTAEGRSLNRRVELKVSN